MAKVFGVSARTIRAWLADAEVQREIATVQEEFLRRTERQFLALFRKSITAMAAILAHGGDTTKLRAVELIWTSVGRLAPKGARITLCNHNHVAMGSPHRPQASLLVPGRQLDRAEYQATMRVIRAERERREREEAAKGEQRDRLTE